MFQQYLIIPRAVVRTTDILVEQGFVLCDSGARHFSADAVDMGLKFSPKLLGFTWEPSNPMVVSAGLLGMF